MIKTEISDHFLTFLITDSVTSSEMKNKRILLYNRTIKPIQKKILKTIWREETAIILKKLIILMKPIANFYVIFPGFINKKHH